MCTCPLAVVFWHPACTCIKTQRPLAKVWIWIRPSRMLLFLPFCLLAFSGFCHRFTPAEIGIIESKGLSVGELMMKASEVPTMEASKGCDNCANCKHCTKCKWCDRIGCWISKNCKYCHHCQHCTRDGFCGKDCNTADQPSTRPTWGFSCK